MQIVNSDKSIVVFSENISMITINKVNEIVVYVGERSYTLQRCVCRSEAENNITKIMDGYLGNKKGVMLESHISQG